MAEHSMLSADLRTRMTNASSADARLSERDTTALVAVRARDDGAMRLARALGHNVLPAPNECLSTRIGDLYWLRPDEWLLAATSEHAEPPMAELHATVGSDDGAVVDVSGSRLLFELTGAATREVLASCCSLDLHPGVFPSGHCAQSLIAKAPVLLHLVDDTPRWHLFTTPSYADYVVRWVVDGLEGLRAERL
jgi:sarcosine oxidase, subunit gamma